MRPPRPAWHAQQHAVMPVPAWPGLSPNGYTGAHPRGGAAARLSLLALYEDGRRSGISGARRSTPVAWCVWDAEARMSRKAEMSCAARRGEMNRAGGGFARVPRVSPGGPLWPVARLRSPPGVGCRPQAAILEVLDQVRSPRAVANRPVLRSLDAGSGLQISRTSGRAKGKGDALTRFTAHQLRFAGCAVARAARSAAALTADPAGTEVTLPLVPSLSGAAEIPRKN